MPASGNKEVMSQNELQQRQQAARKHGAFSKRMTPEKAAQLAELEDQLSTRPGLIEVQRDQTAKSVQIVNAIMGYVVQKYKSGIPLERINTLNRLPAYMNTAQRSLKQLYDMLPDSEDVLDAAAILKELQSEQSE
jgi:hypothetical protein